MSRLELKAVVKTHPGGIVAAQGVDLTVEDCELFVIVGPSGSGKSTLLRIVAGLESLDIGSVHLDGRRIDGLAPADRDVAMVFQDQVLFPHLNVFENIAFGLRARRVAKGKVVERVEETASILGLGDCLDRSPGTLSGGQRRRVALGRALVLRPKLFLFDEPFSGLDAPLRASTRAELADLNRKLKATMVLVTHDQGEALAMGDRIAVIDQGRVVQVGRPIDLYDRPATRFVAGFLGQPPMNLLPCMVDPPEPGAEIVVDPFDNVGPWTFPPEGSFTSKVARSSPWVVMGLRPEHLKIRPDRDDSLERSATTSPAKIRRLEPMGHETIAYLELGIHEVTARLSPRNSFQVGDQVLVDFDFDQATWFDRATGDRLT